MAKPRIQDYNIENGGILTTDFKRKLLFELEKKESKSFQKLL